MPWDISKKSDKAVHKFAAMKGWAPSSEVVYNSDNLWDVKNVRPRDGALRSRGGYVSYLTAQGTIYSLYNYKTSGGSDSLIEATDLGDSNGITVRQYNGSSWINIGRGLSTATPTFCSSQRLDGNDYLLFADGVNRNRKWEGTQDSIEMTGKIVFDSETDESWNVGTRGTSWTSGSNTIYPRTGNNCILLTSTNAAQDTDYLTFGGGTIFEQGGISYWDTFTCFGNRDSYGYTKRAILVSPTTTLAFNKIMFNLKGNGTTEITVTVVNDNSGTPGSTSLGTGTFTPTSSGYNSVTLTGTVTTSSPFWIILDFTADPGINVGWQNTYSPTNWPNKYAAHGSSSWTSDTPAKMYVSLSLTSSTTNLDLNAGYSAGDEFVLDFYVDDVAKLDLTDADTTYIKFTDSAAMTNKMRFHHLNDDIPLVNGWNRVVFAKNHGDWISSGSAWAATEWHEVARIDLYAQATAGNNVNVYFDCLYLRKTLPTDSAGSKSRPPRGKYLVMSPSGARVMLGNTEKIIGASQSGSNFVYYSDSYDLDTWTSGNYRALPSAVTGMITQGGLTHVFCKSERYLFQETFSNVEPFTSVKAEGPGCVSHRSLAAGEYNGTQGLYFLSTDGIYFAAGKSAVRISKSIQTLFEPKTDSNSKWYGENINPEYFDNSVGTYKDGLYYLAYTRAGQTKNDRILVCDGTTGEWSREIVAGSVHPDMVLAIEDDSSVSRILLADSSGTILKSSEERATTQDNSQAITFYWQTPYIGMDLGLDLSYDTFFVWVKSDTTATAALTVSVYLLSADETAYESHTEEVGTAAGTISKSASLTASKWERLKIPLIFSSGFPRGRAISIKVSEDNGLPLDFIPESIVCRVGNEELE